jgi:hypothetical protein
VPTKLTPADLEMIRVAVQLEPGVTLAALVERLAIQGTSVFESTVSRALLKMGLHLKKVTISHRATPGRCRIASRVVSQCRDPGRRRAIDLSRRDRCEHTDDPVVRPKPAWGAVSRSLLPRIDGRR